MIRNIYSQARIIYVLVKRDIFVLRKGLRDDLINAIVKVTAMYIPLSQYFGFTPDMARDVMLGAVVSVFLSRGFVCALIDSFDMSEARFIDYKRTLPLSTSGMLIASLCSYVITLTASTFPLFI